MSKDARLRASVVVAVARAVAAGQRHDWPTKPTARSIHAETQHLLGKRMREAGIKPNRIPKQAEKLQAAICALIRAVGCGVPLKASKAVRQAGFLGAAAQKLAYRVPVKAAAVNAATCLLRLDPFVRRLDKDAGWKRQVLYGHSSLAALARTLENAHLSLPGQATKSGPTPAVRGYWHAEARALRAQGWGGNHIAKHLRVNVKTVETFLRRERLRGESVASTPLE